MNYADRVKETTTATSMSTITLSGAPSGYRAFSSAMAPSAAGIPVCVSDSAGNWELGLYTLSSSSLLTRELIISSSNGGAAVTFPSGSKDVFCTIPASVAAKIVDPTDVGFDIVLCIGQSNMVGFGGTRDALIDCADSRIYQFGGYASDAATYQQIINGVDPLKMPLNDGALGPATAFAKAYAATIPTNRRVLLVPVAVGGTTIVAGTPRWNAGSPGGDLYETAISQANAAIVKAQLLYPNSRYVGAVMAQGESDSGTTQALYVAGLKAVIAGIRSRVTGAANSFFLISGMVPETGKANIVAAHIQVASETSRCGYVAGVSGYTTDNLHYTAPGARIMGSALGLAVRAAMAYIATDTTAPAVAPPASVANATPTVVGIAMTEALDPAFVPAASAFTVGGHTVASVAISGSTLSLTCSTAFVNGEAARTVAYVQPGTNNARDLAGNLLANFSGVAITNNVAAVDVTPPAFVSAQVANAAPTLVVITMGEALAAFTPAASAFAISGKTVSSVAVSGTTITLTASAAYVFGDTISVTYTKPGTNALQDAAGNQTVSFGPSTVTNNVGAAATAPATMNAPTATAGDTTASVVLVAPSDGGSAITGYTVTSSPAGGVDSNAGGTGLTHTITGLTNGVAYTFTATATNAVGTSTASPASNSVTPAAASYIRLSPVTANHVESGSGPYTYTASPGGSYGSGGPFGGVTSQALAADGSFAVTFSGSNETMIGLRLGTTVVDYTGLPQAFYSNATSYKPFTGGVGQTATNTVVRAAGDIMRLRRTGSTLVAEVARSATPTVFTTIYTWTGVSTASAHFQAQIGTGSGTLTNLTGVGMV